MNPSDKIKQFVIELRDGYDIDRQQDEKLCDMLVEAVEALDRIAITKYGLQGYLEEDDQEGAFDYIAKLNGDYEHSAKITLSKLAEGLK